MASLAGAIGAGNPTLAGVAHRGDTPCPGLVPRQRFVRVRGAGALEAPSRPWCAPGARLAARLGARRHWHPLLAAAETVVPPCRASALCGGPAVARAGVA